MKEECRGNLLNPLPVALVGTLIDGKPNYCVIGYISPFNFGKHIFFSLYKKRHTRVGIQKNRTFSVNMPSARLIREVNICGSKSGRDFDKSTLFSTFFGELKTAPMIDECPLTMECKVVEILDYDPNEGIIGEVVKAYADRELIKDGIADTKSAGLIVWTSGEDVSYHGLGERIVPQEP
jgi:flavin reductase (DIM6/NTAB) family NADH-FMN oxidoreductase RutF